MARSLDDLCVILEAGMNTAGTARYITGDIGDDSQARLKEACNSQRRCPEPGPKSMIFMTPLLTGGRSPSAVFAEKRVVSAVDHVGGGVGTRVRDGCEGDNGIRAEALNRGGDTPEFDGVSDGPAKPVAKIGLGIPGHH